MANNTSQNNKYNFAMSIFSQLNDEESVITSSNLIIKKNIVEKFTCIVCYDDYEENNLFCCKNHHKICVECMKQNMNMNLIDEEKKDQDLDKEKILNNKGIIKCPYPNCSENYQPTDLIIKLNDAKLIDKYYKTTQWVSHSKITLNRIQKILDDLYKKFNDKSMDRESRRLQMREALPNARMCLNCNYGPITKVGCDNLQTHGHQFLNSCPRCGDHQTDFSKMKHWDGRLPEETANEDNLETIGDCNIKKIHDNFILKIIFPYQGYIFLDQHRQKLIPMGFIKCEKFNYIVCYVEFKDDNMLVYNNDSTSRQTKEIGFLENKSIVLLDEKIYFGIVKRSRHSGKFISSNKKEHTNLWTCCGCKNSKSTYCNMKTSLNQQKKNNSNFFLKKNNRIFDRPKRNFIPPQHKFNYKEIKKFIDHIKKLSTKRFNKCTYFENGNGIDDFKFLKKKIDHFKMKTSDRQIDILIDKKTSYMYFARRPVNSRQFTIFSSSGFNEVEVKSSQFVLEVVSSKDQFGDWKSAAKNSKSFKINVSQDWNKFVNDAKEKLKHDIKCAHLIKKRKILSSDESIIRYSYTCQALLDSNKYKMNFKYFSNNYIIVCHDNNKAVVDSEKDRAKRLGQEEIRRQERRRRERIRQEEIRIREWSRRQERRRQERTRQEEIRTRECGRRQEEIKRETEKKKREASQKRKRDADRRKRQEEELIFWNDKRKKDSNSRKRSASIQRFDDNTDDFINSLINPNTEPIEELDEQILNSLFD